jgi:UDP-3-O-[3-hydroxymyristoyl] glucosamine N-acyltransferase
MVRDQFLLTSIPNGGGWVADTAKVDEYSFIGPDARVYGTAKIYGVCHIYGNAEIFGNARISGSVHVYGNAKDVW